MGFGRSPQLGFLVNGKIGGPDGSPVANSGNILINNLDPRLWVLLRLHNCASFVEINVTMGPREGRYADTTIFGVSLFRSYCAMELNGLSCTDQR